MSENEDIEVVVDGEPQAEGEPQSEASDEIAELRRQIEEERAKRIEAQRLAAEAQRQAHEAVVEKEDTDLQLVNNAIETLEANQNILRGDYQIAMERGDYAAAAEIQTAMAENAANVTQLKNGRDAMEKRPKAPPPQVHVDMDPVEALADRLTPKSAAWVRSHPEVATDPRLNRKMIRAHQDALDDGLVAESPEYFAYVENRLGFGSSDARPLPYRRESAPAAAPVSRGGERGNPNVIRLTAEQREMAQLTGMTEKEYAAQLLRIQRERKN